MIRKKILLLGDFSVGKTSLIRRYVDGSFDDSYLTTIGVKISKKSLTLEDEACELIIWDVEGTTPSKKIPTSYYRGASGAIFVTDVNRSETIKSLASHIDVFLEVNPQAKYVVAHNKADLLSDKAKESYVLNDTTFLTSAKTDKDVDTLFNTLLKEILQ